VLILLTVSFGHCFHFFIRRNVAEFRVHIEVVQNVMNIQTDFVNMKAVEFIAFHSSLPLSL